jgi:hypothetical protein
MKSGVIVLALGVSLISTACTHSVHVVHVGGFDDVPSNIVKNRIESAAEQKVILGFTRNTDYVNRAYDALKAKCLEGNVDGVTTKFSTSHGFLSWTNKVTMQGQCYKL